MPLALCMTHPVSAHRNGDVDVPALEKGDFVRDARVMEALESSHPTHFVRVNLEGEDAPALPAPDHD